LRHVREAEYAMQEAVATCNRPSQLRFLFAHLLPGLSFPAMELWTHFEQADYWLHHHAMRATDLALASSASWLLIAYPLPLWPA
jgi:hypothetical protein